MFIKDEMTKKLLKTKFKNSTYDELYTITKKIPKRRNITELVVKRMFPIIRNGF